MMLDKTLRQVVTTLQDYADKVSPLYACLCQQFHDVKDDYFSFAFHVVADNLSACKDERFEDVQILPMGRYMCGFLQVSSSICATNTVLHTLLNSFVNAYTMAGDDVEVDRLTRFVYSFYAVSCMDILARMAMQLWKGKRVLLQSAADENATNILLEDGNFYYWNANRGFLMDFVTRYGVRDSLLAELGLSERKVDSFSTTLAIRIRNLTVHGVLGCMAVGRAFCWDLAKQSCMKSDMLLPKGFGAGTSFKLPEHPRLQQMRLDGVPFNSSQFVTQRGRSSAIRRFVTDFVGGDNPSDSFDAMSWVNWARYSFCSIDWKSPMNGFVLYVDMLTMFWRYGYALLTKCLLLLTTCAGVASLPEFSGDFCTLVDDVIRRYLVDNKTMHEAGNPFYVFECATPTSGLVIMPKRLESTMRDLSELGFSFGAFKQLLFLMLKMSSNPCSPYWQAPLNFYELYKSFERFTELCTEHAETVDGAKKLTRDSIASIYQDMLAFLVDDYDEDIVEAPGTVLQNLDVAYFENMAKEGSSVDLVGDILTLFEGEGCSKAFAQRNDIGEPLMFSPFGALFGLHHYKQSFYTDRR